MTRRCLIKSLTVTKQRTNKKKGKKDRFKPSDDNQIEELSQ